MSRNDLPSWGKLIELLAIVGSMFLWGWVLEHRLTVIEVHLGALEQFTASTHPTLPYPLTPLQRDK